MIWAIHNCPVLVPVLRYCRGYPVYSDQRNAADGRFISSVSSRNGLLVGLVLKRQQRDISGGRICLPGTGLVMVDIVRRLVKRRLPELIVTGVTWHPEVPHAAAPFGRLLRHRADAGLPPDLRHTGPQRVTEWAALRLVIEH